MGQLLTRGASVAADVTALLRARNSLLWIVSREEQRAERGITEASQAASYVTRYWDCATGITDGAGTVLAPVQDPSAALTWIRDDKTRAVYVLRDMDPWLRDPSLLRALKSLARALQSAPRGEARALIVLSPSGDVPAAIGDCVTVEWPLPDRTEVARILDETIAALPADVAANAAPNATRDAAIDAAVGLSAKEIESCYARSLVTSRTIDPALVHGEKKRAVTRAGGLIWTDPDPRGLAGVGGLANVKAWIGLRRAAFTVQARAYGLPAPKGILCVGVPGCGKTLLAKCIATALAVPLLRLDFGGLQSKYVGESQQAVRKALALAESLSPCVLHVDEIEKALAGASGPAGDGGVAADALGTFLQWTQERSGSVFVVATANDVSKLPPELLRKGRFDEIFAVDLPTTSERAEIVRVALAEAGARAIDWAKAGDGMPIDVMAVARACAGFAGAEVASLVPDAMFVAFADGMRQITTSDLVTAAGNVVPLAKTAAEKINSLREWAKGRARPASEPETDAAPVGGRALDI